MKVCEGSAGTAFAAAAALALLACGSEPKPAAAPPVTVPLTLPTTAGQILADDPEPPAEEVEPTPPTPTTPTTLATGLPSDLGVPGAGNISLGGGSSISNSFTVREAPFLEVVAFPFTGPGAAGEATVLPQADGTDRVRVTLGGG